MIGEKERMKQLVAAMQEHIAPLLAGELLVEGIEALYLATVGVDDIHDRAARADLLRAAAGDIATRLDGYGEDDA